MHTLDHTAYLITEENFSALSDIIENEWKPLGYTFCELKYTSELYIIGR